MTEKKGTRYVSDNAQLMAEWNWEKNNALGLDPQKLTFGSGKKVWWKCGNSHEWESRIDHRSKGIGCPYCSKKACWPGENDLLTCRPDIATEWNHVKNHSGPESIAVRSNKIVWWKCNKGHEYQTSVSNRVAGQACPYCAGKKVMIGFNDLQTQIPELANEWNYSKNSPLLPAHLTSKSNKVVWWICNKGHEWTASVNNRAKGNGCPICANKIIVKGYNDLVTTHPEVAKEWNYTRNAPLIPECFAAGSGENVWWICNQCGHEWKSRVANRTRGSGCPKCFERNRTSFPEQAVFYYLKKLFPDAINRCTEALDAKNELDIFIPSQNVAIEYDGAFWHDKTETKEIAKYSLCKAKRLRLIRIKEKQSSWDDKSSDIVIYCRDSLNATIVKLGELLGVHIDCCIEKDRSFILSTFYQSVKEQSLLAKNPELAKDWNYEKNGALTPDMFYEFSNEKVWWKCNHGHEWEASISNRSNLGRGCPYCNGQKALGGVNDVFTLFPHLRDEWDEKRNGVPLLLLPGSNKKVWWKCKFCGNEWQTTVNKRTSGQNCPICGIKKRSENRTKSPYAFSVEASKASLNIELLDEYKNTSNKMLVKCKKCNYEWRVLPSAILAGVGCPGCTNRVVIKGRNDLGSQYPLVALDWSINQNGDLTPENIVFGSSRKVYWKCHICQYEWQDTVDHRTSGRGCPECANQKRKKKDL